MVTHRWLRLTWFHFLEILNNKDEPLKRQQQIREWLKTIYKLSRKFNKTPYEYLVGPPEILLADLMVLSEGEPDEIKWEAALAGVSLKL